MLSWAVLLYSSRRKDSSDGKNPLPSVHLRVPVIMSCGNKFLPNFKILESESAWG